MSKTSLSLLSAVFAALLSVEAGAQICHAENDTPNFSDGTSMGGPNLMLAVKFTPSAPIACTRIEVFTGEGSGTNSVPLWSHDAGPNEPLASLGSASWNMSSTNSWQGADLGTPIPLNAGTTYWMVWSPINGSQASVEALATPGQQYRGSFDGGQTWNGPFSFPSSNWKFRLYCNACAGGFQTYGSACPGTGGVAPAIDGTGCPKPLSAITIDMTQMLPGAPAILLLGSSNQVAAITPSCLLQVAPLLPVAVPFTVPGSGSLSFGATLPNDTPVPFNLYLQALVGDPGAADGVASTNALWMSVQ